VAPVRRHRALLAAGLACLLAAQGAAWLTSRNDPNLDLEAMPPGEFAGTLMLAGFRGLACDLLWMRAVGAKDDGRFYESVALADAITRVQPRFTMVWEHLAHDLSYNIAHEADGEEGRWTWFLAGVHANVRGVERNPDKERILRHLAWIFHHRGELFQRRIEAMDFAPIINPLLQRVVDQGGEGVIFLPAGGGQSNYQISRRLYTACKLLSDAQARRSGQPPQINAFVRRFTALAWDADGNRLRNRGEHLAAVRTWIEGIREWGRIAAWAKGEDSSEAEPSSRNMTLESFERNEGRLRRKAAELVRRLAPDAATGEAAAQAIDQRRVDEAERLLALPGWKSAIPGDRVQWLDQLGH
jgi:hypothetical protein